MRQHHELLAARVAKPPCRGRVGGERALAENAAPLADVDQADQRVARVSFKVLQQRHQLARTGVREHRPAAGEHLDRNGLPLEQVVVVVLFEGDLHEAVLDRDAAFGHRHRLAVDDHPSLVSVQENVERRPRLLVGLLENGLRLDDDLVKFWQRPGRRAPHAGACRDQHGRAGGRQAGQVGVGGEVLRLERRAA